ncbi:MAG: four-carbon acid sugar kinase family protein [Lautropia sp.]
MAPICRHAWYGDDFTGASDTLATVADAGLRALLFLGVPTPARLAQAGPLDAIGVAGAARAMDPAAMAAELAPVAPFFASLQARVVHYKCCSTFDSSPTTGSLGAALRALSPALAPAFVAVLGGQPSLGRYCVFGNLFARAGSDGEVCRIDRHPTMSRHPVTPMLEADLRRHLGAQGLREVSLIDMRVLDADAPGGTIDTADGTADGTALDAALDAALRSRPDAILFDVLNAAHLARIGRALLARAVAAPVLALGASSVAQALIAHWRAVGDLPATPPVLRVAPADGPVFLLAGSQSPWTARQVDAALAMRDGDGVPRYAGVDIDVDALARGAQPLEDLASTCARLLRDGRSVLARTSPAREGGPAPLAVAQHCSTLLRRVLELAPAVRRVGVAGGDTSSFAVRALDVWALAHVGSLGPGVSLMRARAGSARYDGIELMLKGGQMGTPSTFGDLLDGARWSRPPSARS